MDLDPTASQELKKLQKYVRALPSIRRMSSLGSYEHRAVMAVLDTLAMAVKLHTDAIKADTSDVMFVSIEACARQLELFREAVLLASQSDLFDAADVAQLTAMSDHIIQLVTGR